MTFIHNDKILTVEKELYDKTLINKKKLLMTFHTIIYVCGDKEMGKRGTFCKSN